MLKTKLIHIECTAKHGPSEYFSTGDDTVVETALGKYREASARAGSRFGYRFSIKHVGRPHLAVIRYPDDKRRFMCVMDGTGYDLSTGITTGFAYPISGSMREIPQIFWPRWRDCTLVFLNWGPDEPAAVASIDIYELDDLPAMDLQVSTEPTVPLRELGIQYEDPCYGTVAGEGAVTREEWTDRVISYARHTGQNLLTYPVAWYHGPIWPSDAEPCGSFEVVVAPDRKQYIRWSNRAPEWIAPMLKRLGREGIKFVGSLTLLRLGTLMQEMNTDLPSIQAGAETINNMLWCDQVQSTAMDWTATYNVLNFPPLVAAGGKHEVNSDGFSGLAYGEKRARDLEVPYHAGPIFNPLHPRVQHAVKTIVREFAERYAGFPALQGLSINFWAPTIAWFGSIHSGYDDFTIGLFEEETGVRLPIAATDPHRFSKRHEYLTFRCRPLWIEWRCRKVHQLLCSLRDELIGIRPDLRLILTFWSEPYLPHLVGNGTPESQFYARPSTVEFYREAGFDPALYRGEPNIEVDFQFEGGGRDRSANGRGENPTLESFFMFRDHDFLDEETLGVLRSLESPGAFIMNAWHESWGEHRWFDCEPDDPQKKTLAAMSGQPVDGIFQVNSEYPDDGFWFDSQMRITHAFPPGEHFLEQYAHALAGLDACRITRGGLFLDKTHSAEIRRFASAYRNLPAQKFETVGLSTDPVAVRTLVPGGASRRYLYLVNRDHYPVKVRLTLSQATELADLRDGTTVSVPSEWNIELQPYELLSFTAHPTVEVIGFSVKIPVHISTALENETQVALKAMTTVRQSGYHLAGLDRLQEELRRCLQNNHYARIRHILTGYHVQKCLQLGTPLC